MPRLRVGYWAAQEQYDPHTLIRYARHAEVVGFDLIVTSDHFHPWRDKGGQAGFPWVWLATLASQTSETELGTAVTTPLLRYHPAIVAQAFATLDYLYPGRIFLTIGTGHKLNEAPLGFNWMGYREKVDRLREAIEIIQTLWRGSAVTYDGKYYTLRRAELYTKPKKKIPLYVATSNVRVAAMAGRMTDGILTNPRGLDRYRKIIHSMDNAAKAAGKDPSKLARCMEFKVAYDVDYDQALASALYWAPTAIPRGRREHVVHPSEFEELVGPREIEKIKESWLITTSSDAIIERLGEFLKMGFDRVYIHSASPNEDRFLDLLGRDILPWMREYYESLVRPVSLAYE
ncbi:MAG: TIGR03557 family F420-dependent LLM class oxidoreductase [Candidatus Geothermarchaeales archaeon]